jgi:hypothetical protein
MSDYRVYIIGDDGHFQKAFSLDCGDDNAAIESAKLFIDGHDLELWQRDRLVARLDHRRKDATGWQTGEIKPPE